MTTVWSTTSQRPSTVSAAEDDVVVRLDGDRLAVGRVRAGGVSWLAETLAVASLPAGALDGLPESAALAAVEAQAALLTAAEGLETALVQRGG